MKQKQSFYWYQFSKMHIPTVLLFFFMSMLGILFMEYRFFCVQSQKMMLLKEQYHAYLATVKKKLEQKNNTHQKHECINNGQVIIGTITKKMRHEDGHFVKVNRQIGYLKESTFAYLKMQQLDFLISSIDQQLLDYSDHIQANDVHGVAKQRKKKKTKKTFKCSWPIEQESFWLSSLFGPRKKEDGSWGFHYGIDMAAMKGTPIKAAHAGSVKQAGYISGYGNTVVVQYNNNFKTRYAHLDTIFVYKGQKIKKGNNIGTVGDTGFIRKNGNDGSHLHFEVYKNGKQVNPLLNLPIIS